jgi:lysophospholipase L1-like esterase
MLFTRHQFLRGAGTMALAALGPRAVAWAVDVPIPQTAKLTNQYSYRLADGDYQSTPRDQTVSVLHNLETVPTWVRLTFFNDQPQSWTINAAAVAMTSAVGDGYTPVNAAGAADAALWQVVRFNSGGQDKPQQPQNLGEAFSLTLPPNPGSPGQPVLAFSDWMPLAPVPRTDGGFGALLLVRVHAEQQIRTDTAGAPDPTLKRTFAAYLAPGNGAAAPWALHDPKPTNFNTPYGLQFTATPNGATVIGIGDSIMSSLHTTGGDSGFGVRACVAISTAARPVSYFNEAYSGRLSTDFCPDGIRDLQLLSPQVAIIQAWSENDQLRSQTQETADACFARAMTVTQAAASQGCVPILCTAAPVFAHDPTLEAFRRSNNAKVRDAAKRGYAILDLDDIWGTGAKPNAYRPEYNSGDDTHPNDLACAAAAKVLAPMLARMLAAS